jgi:GTPase SAR1 family protein
MSKEFDLNAYRIAVIGPEHVGRTAFIARFIRGIFLPPHIKPFESKFRKKCSIDGMQTSILIFDGGNGLGTEAFDEVANFDSRVYFLLYSASSNASFLKLKSYAELIPQDSIVFLIANKSDLPEKVEIEQKVFEVISEETPAQPPQENLELAKVLSDFSSASPPKGPPGPGTLDYYRASIVLTEDVKEFEEDFSIQSRSPTNSVVISEKKFKEISTEEGFKLAKELKCFEFIEVSAKDGVNVTEAFEDAIRILRRYDLSPSRGEAQSMRARSQVEITVESISRGFNSLFASLSTISTKASSDFSSLFSSRHTETPEFKIPKTPAIRRYLNSAEEPVNE